MTVNNFIPLPELRALARKSAETGRPDKAARLYRLAAEQTQATGDTPGSLDLLNRALALSSDANTGRRFDLLANREQLLGRLGRIDDQKRDLASLEALANQLDDDGRRALVAARQADVRAAGGDLDAAASLARLALRLAELTHSEAPAASAHLTLGDVLTKKADFQGARRHLRLAAEQAIVLNAPALQADALRNLGVLANDTEQFEEAIVFFREANALYAELDDRRGLAQVHNNLGHVYAHQGRLAQAQAHWQETQRIFDSIDDARAGMRILVNLGAINLDLGQYEAAREFLQQARARAEKTKSSPGICFASLNLALAAHHLGQHDQALQHADVALTLAGEMGARRIEGAALLVMAHACSGKGEYARAGDLYWEALAIWEELELPNVAAEARAGLARIALANNAPSLGMFFVNEIVTQMEVDPRLEGTESPVQIYLTVYKVMRKNGAPRADEMLFAGHELLMQRIEGLDEEGARHAVLHNIPAHRELIAAYNV